MTLVLSVPCTPLATLHTVDVSDCQSLASHVVTPTRWESVERYVPKSAPITVTLIEPVDGTLNWVVGTAALSPRTDRSKENASVTEPTRTPAVTATRNVPCTPLAIRHLTCVSDSHSLLSHAV